MEEKETEERGPVEIEPAVIKITEIDCRPRKQYQKRDPLADYNKPPVPKSSAAENQADGPSNKLEKRRDPLVDYNKPPVLKSSVAEIKRAQPNPLAKPKSTTAGEKNHQHGISNGSACSKNKTAATTVGEKGRVGKSNATGAKSNRTEALNNTPTPLRQSAEPNPQSLSCGGEPNFLCFFCSKTKDVKERHPGRLNTCTQCHAYYMAQVAGRKSTPSSLYLCLSIFSQIPLPPDVIRFLTNDGKKISSRD